MRESRSETQPLRAKAFAERMRPFLDALAVQCVEGGRAVQARSLARMVLRELPGDTLAVRCHLLADHLLHPSTDPSGDQLRALADSAMAWGADPEVTRGEIGRLQPLLARH